MTDLGPGGESGHGVSVVVALLSQGGDSGVVLGVAVVVGAASSRLMPTPRHGIATASFGGVIYVLGGGTEFGFSSSPANEAFKPE